MKKGRKGYKCILTSEKTGKSYEFKSARQASTFLERQRTYVNTCVYKGLPLTNKYTGERFAFSYPDNKRQTKKPKGFKEQPCCTCGKALGWCAWSDRFEPVPGWDAVPTIIHAQFGKDIHSYAILKCPDYEWG